MWQRVIAALVLGVIVGLAWGPEAESIKIIGDVFIASIKMLVVPLIFFSLVSGAAIRSTRKCVRPATRCATLRSATWPSLAIAKRK